VDLDHAAGRATPMSLGIDSDTSAGVRALRPGGRWFRQGHHDPQDGQWRGRRVLASVDVELKGNVAAGQNWTLQLRDISAGPVAFASVATYTTRFGDTLADIAHALAASVEAQFPAIYDVSVLGRVITLATTAQQPR
jgi:hypothetical protein